MDDEPSARRKSSPDSNGTIMMRHRRPFLLLLNVVGLILWSTRRNQMNIHSAFESIISSSSHRATTETGQSMFAELNEQRSTLHAKEKVLNKSLAEEQNSKTFQQGLDSDATSSDVPHLLTSLETSWKLLDQECHNNTNHDQNCIQKFPRVFRGPAVAGQSRDLDTQQITLVTHCAVNRDKLRILSTQAKQWGGPVSAAIYIRKAEDVSQLVAFIQESPHNWTNKITFHAIMESFHGELYQGYPHNRLRNLALDEAKTDYVLLMDVDFMTNPNAHDNIVSLIQQDTEMLDMLRSKKFAFALPPFDILPAPGKDVTDPELLPQSKQEILAGISNQTIVPFYEKTNWASHNVHKYSIWKENPTSGKQHYYYNVTYRRNAEPYVLAYRQGLPSYCEGLRGYGFNKVSYFWSLNYIGYKFAVLRDFYVAHLHHPPVSKLDYDRGVQRNRPIYEHCRMSIKELYGNDTTTTGRNSRTEPTESVPPEPKISTLQQTETTQQHAMIPIQST